MAKPIINITGQKFGRLIVIEFSHIHITKSGQHVTYWKCECECGNMKELSKSNLISGNSKSCGCLYEETKDRHGYANHDLYRVWISMIDRCFNPKCHSWDNYGGRGISVCERWKNIENFIIDMGVRPEGYSIDRINNDGNYSPDNCKWSSASEQANNRRVNVIEHNGKSQTMRQWASELKINYTTLLYRLHNWTIDKALSTPLRKRKK